MDNLRQIKHLYARAGFGLGFDDLKTARHSSIKKLLKIYSADPKEMSLSVPYKTIPIMLN
jgi:hypothetical protein